MLVVDARGNVVALNPEAERFFGWPEADFLGESLHRVIPPRFQELANARLGSNAETGLPTRSASVSLFARRAGLP